MKIHANRTTGNCSRWPDCGWAWLPGKAILIAALAVTNTLAPMGQVRLRNLKSKPMVKVPTTFLQVRLPSVTGTKWGNHLKINWQMKSVKSGGTQQQALWFRWTTGRVFRLSPSITLIPQGIPSVVYIYAYGEDDDRPDGLEGDRFVVAGAYPSGKPIKGFDIAKGSTFIRLTAGHTQAVAPRPFPKIVATGPDGLRFTVKGTWQVAP